MIIHGNIIPTLSEDQYNMFKGPVCFENLFDTDEK